MRRWRGFPTVNGMRVNAYALVPVLLLGGACLAGCQLSRNTLVDGVTGPAAVTEVRLVDSGSGDLKVRVDATATQAEVKRTVHYGGSAPAQTARFDGSVLLLSMACGSDCSVSYDVTLPAPARVDGTNGSGDITLSDVSSVDVTVGSGTVQVDRVAGPVSVATSSGDIDVTAVSGAVSLRARSGDITARQLAAPTSTVEATSGDVELQLTVAGDVTVHTTSGNIDVRAPGGPYKVTTQVTSGDVKVDIPTDPAATHTIDAQATSGNITVAHG